MAELVQYYGTGRRKRAIARVYLRPGSGDFKVNGREFEEYFRDAGAALRGKGAAWRLTESGARLSTLSLTFWAAEYAVRPTR
jgi:hypothetical protein